MSTWSCVFLGRKRTLLAEQEDTVGEKPGMATRRAVVRVTAQPAWAAVARRMEGVGSGARVSRYFSDKASGRVLSEEERAAENVYIQVRW